MLQNILYVGYVCYVQVICCHKFSPRTASSSELSFTQFSSALATVDDGDDDTDDDPDDEDIPARKQSAV